MPSANQHYITRHSWLRAAVMGANDGVISTSGLLMGMAGAGVDSHVLLITGIAGLVAGATSMAAGEYVSVSSQADMEKADLHREAQSISNDFAAERDELVSLYIERGLSRALAEQVATQLMDNAPLETHAREELGIVSHNQANPLQAALVSALTFSAGAAIPIASILATTNFSVLWNIAIATLFSLALLGYGSAKMGGASPWRSITRVCFWGGVAMILGSVTGHWLT